MTQRKTIERTLIVGSARGAVECVVADFAPDAWGVKCNLIAARSEARSNALCWVINANPGGGADRIEVLMQSRGGRKIRLWIATKKLANFRAGWLPEQMRSVVRTWEAKATAEAWAESINERRAGA